MKGLMDTSNLTLEQISNMLELAQDIMDNKEKYSDRCKGKKLATLFFEPSTRTRLSFEAAMLELGGSVLGFSEASSSSSTKGESVHDTACVVSNYADIIAMRHPQEGAPMVAMQAASVPVINAGDGGHKHPTQTLGDLLTIYQKFGRLDNLTIGLCGDLKYGRTVHSLVEIMKRYENIKFVFIAPSELEMPNYIKKNLSKDSYRETKSLEEALPELDVLYMTRVQRERFDDIEEYERVKDVYVLDVEKMQYAPSHMCIMHPLPRVNEIAKAVDKDERACYFEQALYGKYMRMALILQLLGLDDAHTDFEISLDADKEMNERVCKNPKCITKTERDIEHLVKNSEFEAACCYCEKEIG